MIPNLSQGEFVASLHRHLSPTAPIQSQENLYGRETQVRAIEQALYAPGRTIFIHGDRGVGKTSLAHTVAFAHQSARGEPVILACTPETTFSSIIRDVVNALQSEDHRASALTQTAKVGVGVASYEIEHTRHRNATAPVSAVDLNTAVAALLRIAEARKNEQMVVVIDEFDRITSQAERTHFADFIKQLADQRIGIKFVFCGVAESLEKLLGAHESCYRYIASIQLPRLSWDARWEIIDGAAKALGVVVDDHPRFRIAAISDGFPHYVHLVCEKLFWEMFDDPDGCTKPTIEHYRAAVAQSVLGIEQHLQKAYDHATMKNSDGYEEVLWAVADHSDLVRSSDSIYQSYENIAITLDIDQPMDRTTFSTRMQALKSPGCGQILASNRRGWYQFRESIVRGYVRLRAEEKGLELALDYAAGTATSTTTWRPRGARRSRRGMTAQDLERLRNPQQ